MLFQRLNKFFRNNPLKKSFLALEQKETHLNSRRGQVAIIMLILIAVALIFYAVSLNFSKSSDTKTIVTIASTNGASVLASEMASYGQMIFKTSLGGKRKICSMNGVLAALLIAIAVIIVVIIIVTTATTGTPAGLAILGGVLTGVWAAVAIVLLIISAIMAIVSVALQIAYVEPKLTAMWNKMQNAAMGTNSQFLERGIQSAIQNSVGDRVRVADLTDMDSDRMWGLDANGKPRDTINRFAFYYTQRLRHIEAANTQPIEDFQNALSDLVNLSDKAISSGPTTIPPHWGLYDEGFEKGECEFKSSDAYTVPSECNKCCVPYQIPWSNGSVKVVRPTQCDCSTLDPNDENKCDISDEEGTAYSCQFPAIDTRPPNRIPPNYGGSNPPYPQVSPYSEYNSVTNSPFWFVFDPLYENRENNKRDQVELNVLPPNTLPSNIPLTNRVINWDASNISLREGWGRDDENPYYRKKLNDINGIVQDPIRGVPPSSSPEFRMEDATGYLTTDKRPGIYSIFYKMRDWAVSLDSLDPKDKSNQCFWCDDEKTAQENNPFCVAASVPPAEAVVFGPNHLDVQQQPETRLNLLYDRSEMEMETLSNCIDKDNVQSHPPLRSDKVREMPGVYVPTDAPAFLDNLPTGANKKPDGYPDADGGGAMWSQGMDRYCSGGDTSGDLTDTDRNWPYFMNNNKSCMDDDAAGNPIPPYDALDKIFYQLENFIGEVKPFLNTDVSDIANNFEQYYDEIAQWIESPPTSPPPQSPLNSSISPGCFNCNAGEVVDNPEKPNQGDTITMKAGVLPILSAKLQILINRVDSWIAKTSFLSDNCSDAWCLPPKGACQLAQGEDTYRYLGDPNTVDGNIEDIIACLTYNVDGYNSTTGRNNVSGTNQGNDFRFNQCATNCDIPSCSYLPRSLFPVSPAYNNYDPRNYIRTPSALDDPVVSKFIHCLIECNQINCTSTDNGGNLSPYWPSDGPLVTIPYPPFDPATTCNNWGPGNTYYDFIQGANPVPTLSTRLLTKAPSCNLAPNMWLDMTRRSGKEAIQQVAKFRARRDFLQARLNEIKYWRMLMQQAKDKIDAFLSCQKDPVTNKKGAACEMVEYRNQYEKQTGKKGLPPQVIYVWKSAETAPGKNDGRWHAVRVDARMPGKCNGWCAGDDDDTTNNEVKQTPGNPFPYVKTDSGTFTRCYVLTNTEGFVKMRVTRWDQPSSSQNVFFPNGVPIWDFRVHRSSPLVTIHNQIAPGSMMFNAIEVPRICGKFQMRDPGQTGDVVANPAHLYKDAFILNERISVRDPSTFPNTPPAPNDPDPTGEIKDTTYNAPCWDLMTQLLAYGVTSETCAKYYLKLGDRPGFNFKFVNCNSIRAF